MTADMSTKLRSRILHIRFDYALFRRIVEMRSEREDTFESERIAKNVATTIRTRGQKLKAV